MPMHPGKGRGAPGAERGGEGKDTGHSGIPPGYRHDMPPLQRREILVLLDDFAAWAS